MRTHLTASLERLNTDYADLYYLHRINPDIPVEAVAEVMGKFIQDGMIRGYECENIALELLSQDFGR